MDRYKPKREHLNINADGIIRLIDDIIYCIDHGDTRVLQQAKNRLEKEIESAFNRYELMGDPDFDQETGNYKQEQEDDI